MVHHNEDTTRAGLANAASQADKAMSRKYASESYTHAEKESSSGDENPRVGRVPAHKVIVVRPHHSQRPVSFEAQIECVSPVQEQPTPSRAAQSLRAKFTQGEDQSSAKPEYNTARLLAHRRDVLAAATDSKSRRVVGHRDPDLARAARRALLETEPGPSSSGSYPGQSSN